MLRLPFLLSPFSFLLSNMVFKLNYDFHIATDLYHLHFEEGKEPHATIKRTPNSAIIYMPKGFSFEGTASLEWANKVLAEALRTGDSHTTPALHSFHPQHSIQQTHD